MEDRQILWETGSPQWKKQIITFLPYSMVVIVILEIRCPCRLVCFGPITYPQAYMQQMTRELIANKSSLETGRFR